MATAAQIQALTEYVKPGAYEVSSSDASFIESCIDEAIALVAGVSGGDVALVPTSILDRCYLEVGSELYQRRQAPNGVAQFAAVDGTAIRIARDPLVGAYPLLRPFMRGGFA